MCAYKSAPRGGEARCAVVRRGTAARGGPHPQGVFQRKTRAKPIAPPGASVRRREILSQGFPPRNLMNGTETPAEPTDALVAEIIEAAISRRPSPTLTEEQRLEDWLGRVLHGEGEGDDD